LKKFSESGNLAGASILSAIAASLCCIAPVLALISGAGGIASSFSWLEPARPFLLGITTLVLSFAWYQKLKPSRRLSGHEEIQCACEEDGKHPFMQTKKFLGIVTVFAFIMMAFPYYGHLFYPKAEKQASFDTKNSIQEVKFNISGMTCSSCAEHIKHEVSKLSGILKTNASYEHGNAIVEFDTLKTNITEITNAINSTGYSVTDQK